MLLHLQSLTTSVCRLPFAALCRNKWQDVVDTEDPDHSVAEVELVLISLQIAVSATLGCGD